MELASTNPAPIFDDPGSDAYLQGSDIKGRESGQRFESADSFLDFVTKRWTERWVTTDIWDRSFLEKLLIRPFVLLISVDAPVGLRWQRFRER